MINTDSKKFINDKTNYFYGRYMILLIKMTYINTSM